MGALPPVAKNYERHPLINNPATPERIPPATQISAFWQGKYPLDTAGDKRLEMYPECLVGQRSQHQELVSEMSMEDITQSIAPYVSTKFGPGEVRLTRLCGDASNRIYYRGAINGASFIVMQLGSNPFVSEEAAAAESAKELPFLNVQRFLFNAGLSVPEIYQFYPNHGLLLLEDLGDVTLESVVATMSGPNRETLYREVIGELY
jgi:hypothetical protein